MSTNKILITETLGKDGLAILQANANLQVETREDLSPEKLKAIIPDFQCLVVRSQTQVNNEIIQAGSSLKLIARAGVGLDNVDIKAAHERKIAVINTPTANSISTAEYAFGMMLALLRNIPQGQQHLKAGLWNRNQFKGVELAQKTLGLIGFGNVGKLMAKRAQAFDMKVAAYDPMVANNIFKDHQVEALNLQALLNTSDVISLHCGLNEKTRKLICTENIEHMKTGVFLVNTARGDLINNGDLLAALNQGKISGAALDVYQEEPPKADDPLLHHPKIIATPHLAASTIEAQAKVSTILAQQIIEFFA